MFVLTSFFPSKFDGLVPPQPPFEFDSLSWLPSFGGRTSFGPFPPYSAELLVFSFFLKKPVFLGPVSASGAGFLGPSPLLLKKLVFLGPVSASRSGVLASGLLF